MAILDIRAWSLSDLLIAILIFAAVIAIVVIAVRAMGLTIPDWVVQIGWIVAIAVVAVVAIKIVLSL